MVSAVFNPASTSNAITQSWVYVDFEDIFLNDRDCSLRLKFNPQVSSFKNIIQEQKIETIGNRFPFFFRNGQLQYREIPISGLISTEMDEYFAAALSAQDTSLEAPQMRVRSRVRRRERFIITSASTVRKLRLG